ncbi:hypothetical protein AVEN_69780-1 [Araneus ventricosus]|uniref:Tc1-like transposase DDE domain-containing protein n=1 Tax=Araneus ventricosus TaxID=182803 RepID=A0A4Y2CZ51_ARAVE|nr:hypothetical protein AVEN_69780-1 [Araneus ventricosus]
MEIYVFPQTNYLEAVTRNSIVFIQEGATPHFSISVREALNERFPNSWIGRDGTIPWPARSPYLTPLDFLFWGYIRNIVYSENITDISDLKSRIIAAIKTVTPQILHNTWREIDYRLDVCRATNGAHIETY